MYSPNVTFDASTVVNVVPQKSVYLPDGIYSGTIRAVNVRNQPDLLKPGNTVETLYFHLELALPQGRTVVVQKVYNITSTEARNSLCGELALLGFEVHNRIDFATIQPQLKDFPVFVKVTTRINDGDEPVEHLTTTTYTFVTEESANSAKSVNDRVKW